MDSAKTQTQIWPEQAKLGRTSQNDVLLRLGLAVQPALHFRDQLLGRDLRKIDHLPCCASPSTKPVRPRKSGQRALCCIPATSAGFFKSFACLLASSVCNRLLNKAASPPEAQRLSNLISNQYLATIALKTRALSTDCMINLRPCWTNCDAQLKITPPAASCFLLDDVTGSRSSCQRISGFSEAAQTLTETLLCIIQMKFDCYTHR